MKKCRKCSIEKPLEMFYRHSNFSCGYEAQCKECRNTWRREYGRANKDKEAANAQRWRKKNQRRHMNNVLMQNFGISVEQYETMLNRQNGLCKICDEVNPDGKRLFVDHDHATGTIRGLLCDRCNRGIGFLRDSVRIAKSAVLYLQETSALEKV